MIERKEIVQIHITCAYIFNLQVVMAATSVVKLPVVKLNTTYALLVL